MALSNGRKNGSTGKPNGKDSENASAYFGLHNLRTGTPLEVVDGGNHYLIATRLGGMEIHHIDVRIDQNHLIIEGYIENHHGQLKRGRWIRHLQLASPIKPDYIDAQYSYDGWLVIKVSKA